MIQNPPQFADPLSFNQIESSVESQNVELLTREETCLFEIFVKISILAVNHCQAIGHGHLEIPITRI